MEAEQQKPNYAIVIPEDLTGGTYANFLAIWHSAHEFTLDFAVTQPPQPEDPEKPESKSVLPCVVVARIKVPVTIVFEMLKALNQNLTKYEDRFGKVDYPKSQESQE